MSATLIAIFLGAGIGGWVYSQFYKRTGGNSKTSWLAAGITFAIVFGAVLLTYAAFS